jgi:hypothetical protein
MGLFPELVGQLLSEILQSPLQQACHGTLRFLHSAGNFRQRPAVQVLEPDCLGLVGGKLRERTRQPCGTFSPHDSLAWAGEFDHIRTGGLIGTCFLRDCSLLGFEMMASRVDEVPFVNAVQPTGEIVTTDTVKLAESSNRRQACLLDDVRRINPPGETPIHRSLSKQPQIVTVLVE